MATSELDRRATEPVLDSGDIQADVTLGVNMKSYLLVLYLDVEDTAKAKTWLRDVVVPAVTTTDAMRAFRERFREARKLVSDGTKPVLPGSATCTVAFSYAGLEALDAPDVDLFKGPDGFGTAFSIGLEARAGLLGDLASGHAPDGWVTGARTPHVLLQLGTDAPDEFEAMKRRYGVVEDPDGQVTVVSSAATNASSAVSGVRVVHADVARRLDALGSEQFGFHDAVSNPALRGFFSDGVAPLYARSHPADADHALPGQDLVYPGEFVILNDATTNNSTWTEGLAGDGGARQPSPETWESKYASSMPAWAKNGAFLVNRRLRQDVAGFWAWCDAEAAKSSSSEKKAPSSTTGGSGFSAEELAAKMFGRWPSGCPLARSPLEDVEALGADASANNAYGFACPRQIRTLPTDTWPRAVTEDVDGTVCPLAAHTRKMNPRDGINDASSPFKRRIVRRGLPYGPPLADPRSGVDDGKDRGLQFVAYCSNIEEQFEFLQRRWANSAHSPTDPTSVDPIIGQVAPGASKPFAFVDCAGKQRTVDPQGAGKDGASQFVAATGGGYFFSPSMTALADVLAAAAPQQRNVKSVPFLYNFPGDLRDLPATARPAWSSTIAGLFESMVSRLPADAPYFSLADDPDAVFLETRRITWDGFAHKFVSRYASDGEIFAAADELQPGDVLATNTTTYAGDAARRERVAGLLPSRPASRQMDEYCEWRAERDAVTGKIVHVDVTTELPEYWAYMFSVAPDTVVALYREHVSPDVEAADLVDGSGAYDKYNKWNTQLGCMHLQQPEDTAGAAVGICGSSTTQLVDDTTGLRYAGKQRLMEAHGAGSGSSSPLRGSDPSITQDIYELCAPGRASKLTLADPIGVYMDVADVSGWAAPDGAPLDRGAVVTLLRGRPGRALRYRIAAPAGADYVLGDCTVGGQRVDYGGQVIKNAITCYLTVQTYRAPVAPATVPAKRAARVPRCPFAAAAAANVVKAEAVVVAPGFEEDPDTTTECHALLREEDAAPASSGPTTWARRLFGDCCNRNDASSA